ncbi:MAG: hydantoinase/carbamoylase family amidase [Gammaproteobacteria bacterium]
MSELRVNGERLWQSLMTMAEIGATAKGGVCRLTLSDEDRRGRDLFRSWCEEAGLTVTVDQMGSMFGHRPGSDPGRPPVVLGSHLDSQPTGGKFDGTLGVLAALEVVRALNDRGIATKAPLEVVNWTNEEGARFAPAMIASGVFAGVFDLDYALARADRDGRTIGAELQRIGYAGRQKVGHRPLGALFELHIEQGPILEAEGKRIGVVTGTTTEKVLADYFREQSIRATLVPMKDHDEGLAGLQASTVDGYASDKVILVGLALRARGTTRFALLPETLSYEPYGFMVRRDDSAFRLLANRTLARIYRSGTIRTLYAKWFGALGRPTPALLLMYNLQGLPE